MMKTIKAVAAFAALLTASATLAESVDAKSYVPTYDAAKAWYLGELGVTNLLNAGITGRGVKVGVVDTGIGDIVTGTHTNLKCAAVHGVPSGAPHGTGVEGIIASDTFGIAPECSLYAYEGTGFVDDINGLWWCLTNGCKVVNFSGGYTPFDYTESQLEWARQQIRTMIDDYGLILVAAGGNAPNETLSFPQDMEGVINVGGITRALESAGLNDNWAKDFCAFGQNVPVFTSRTGATGVNGGSSFAAPMVTGIIALCLQQNPELTRDEIYGILKDACRKLAEGRSKVYGFGLVQAATLPANHKTQAQIDAEKAAYVKTTKLELVNNESITRHIASVAALLPLSSFNTLSTESNSSICISSAGVFAMASSMAWPDARESLTVSLRPSMAAILRFTLRGQSLPTPESAMETR